MKSVYNERFSFDSPLVYVGQHDIGQRLFDEIDYCDIVWQPSSTRMEQKLNKLHSYASRVIGLVSGMQQREGASILQSRHLKF